MKDLIGALCSGICIIHCLFTPILLLVGVSVAGINLVESEWIHWALVVPIIFLALWSLPSGWKSHGDYKPLIFGAAGVILMILSVLVGHQYESYITVSAGLLLISAHLYNRRLVIKRVENWT